MPSTLKIGSTFRFWDRPNDRHLYVISSDLSAPEVVIFNVKTLHEGDLRVDRSCVLNHGDHPFLMHESYVANRYAELIATNKLEQKIADGTLVLHEQCSNETLKRIWDGAETTRHLHGWIREVLISQSIIAG